MFICTYVLLFNLPKWKPLPSLQFCVWIIQIEFSLLPHLTCWFLNADWEFFSFTTWIPLIFSGFLSYFSAYFQALGSLYVFWILWSFQNILTVWGNLIANIFAWNKKLENSSLLIPYHSVGYFVQVKFLTKLRLILYFEVFVKCNLGEK